MPSFEEKFIKSKGKPIYFKGNKLYLFDDFDVEDCERIKLVIESTNSEFEQGISLLIKKGLLIINKQKIKKGAYIWESTAPKEVIIEVKKSKILRVYNVWKDKDFRGVYYANSAKRGAAMIVEKIKNGKRYRCNDGEPDEDFDDIIFRIERIN